MRGTASALTRSGARRRLVTAAAGLMVAIALLVPMAGTTLASGGNVTIAGFAFAPTALKVHVGDTVTWSNNDAVGHTATSAGAFDTGTIASGSTASVTMAKAGTFTYHCSIHPSMTGTIVVAAAAGGSTPAASLPATDASPDVVAGSTGYGWIILLAAIGAIAATLLRPARRGARRGRRD